MYKLTKEGVWKKIIGLIMATVLVSSLSFPAMADGKVTDTQEKDIKQTITAATQIAPVNKDFLKYQKEIERGMLKDDGEDSKNGLIPSPVTPHGTVKETTGRHVRLGLPSSYDLRKHNKMTPVKDQGPCSCCWTFAAYGSLESTMMPQYNDFSEKNMRNLHGFDIGPDKGGNRYMSTAYMARWSGPIEEDDRYSFTDFWSRELTPKKELIKAVYLPDVINGNNMDDLKRAIIKHGAVASTIRGGNEFLNEKTFAHYNYTNKDANHAITIAGWDDNYSRDNFKVKPKRNGAWLVKDSWGQSWRLNGYFWVSYEDNNIAKRNVQYFAQDKGEFKNIYQYDPLGQTTSIGGKSGYFANVFETGNTAQLIRTVGVYVPNHNTDYKVYMVKNYRNKRSLMNRVEVKRGHFDYAGYYVVRFNKPVHVPPFTKFAPVVYFSSDERNVIPVENQLKGYSSKANSSSGQSFTSYSGIYFQDLYKNNSLKNANVWVKAFSDDVYEHKPPRLTISARTNKNIYKSGENIKFTVNVKYNHNRPAVGETINVKIHNYNGVIQTNNYGKATLEFPINEKMPEGTYTAYFNLKYRPNIKTSTKFTINKIGQQLKLTAECDKGTYTPGDEITFKVHLTDQNGQGLADKNIDVKIKKYQEVINTNYDGKESLYVHIGDKIQEGTYTAYFSLQDDPTIKTTVDFKVTRTTLTAKCDKDVYKTGDTIKFEVKLADKNGDGIANKKNQRKNFWLWI